MVYIMENLTKMDDLIWGPQMVHIKMISGNIKHEN